MPRPGRSAARRSATSARRENDRSSRSRRNACSRSLDDDLRDDVGHVFARIDGFLQPAIELSPFDQQHDVGWIGKERAVAVTIDAIRHVFQTADFSLLLLNFL